MKDIVNLTPDVFAYIGSISGQAVADYEQKKFQNSSQRRNSDQADQEVSDGNDNGAEELNSTLTIAAADALPNVHAQQREIIGRFIQCALNYIEKDYPLLEGEKVESDFASFLTEPFNKFPASTAVIKRKTNMAENYYLISNVMVDDKGNLYKREFASPPSLTPRKLKLDASSLATTAASKLVSGLAGAIGGAIGSYIFESLFPPGVPQYFDQVYAEITKIVDQRLQENSITKINGAINTVKERIVTEYTPAKKQADIQNRKDRKQLFALLQKYDTTFLSGPDGMLGTLQDKQYSLAGFGVFLLGASLQLALFQEMANVVDQTDREGHWLKPSQTSYGLPGSGTVAATATNFANYAEKTWPEVTKKRIEGINWYTYEANKYVIPGSGGDIYWELWGAIRDHDKTVLHRQIEKSADKHGNYPSLDQLKNDVPPYVGRVKDDLTRSYSDPSSIIQGWRKLVGQPILLQ